MKRPVTPTTRFEVLQRDGFRCRYCGAKAPEVLIGVDHVIPVSCGGTNDPANLVAACAACNTGKGARLLGEMSAADVRRGSILLLGALDALDHLAADPQQVQSYQNLIDHFLECWNDPLGRTVAALPDWQGWTDYLRRFYLLGLDGASQELFIDLAYDEPRPGQLGTWKAFCGSAWKLVQLRIGQAVDVAGAFEAGYRSAALRTPSANEPRELALALRPYVRDRVVGEEGEP